MTDQTFHMTKEDVRKPESKASHAHGGNVPSDSAAAAEQSIVDSAGDKNKAQTIEERKANLPLPEQPPVASDFSSANANTVNVGSGGQATGNFSKGDDALRSPATNVESQAGVGREGLEGALPNDAATRGKKDQSSLKDTTGKDYGYPQRNDPADTSKLP